MVVVPFGMVAPAKVVVEGAPARLCVIVLLSPDTEVNTAS